MFWNYEARALLSDLDNSDVLGVEDVDASELDDLSFLEDRVGLQGENVLLVSVVDEEDLVLLGINLGGLEDNINISGGDSVSNSILLVGRFDERRPPGDELDLLLAEELVRPVSELGESVSLEWVQSSVVVLVLENGLVVGGKVGISLVALVDEPVGELGLVGDELTSLTEDEVESSESDDVTDALGLWCLDNRVRVDVDGDELVEFDFLVLDVGLEVESRIYNLDLGHELLLIFELERLADIDDNTESVSLVSLVFGLCCVSLMLIVALRG